MNSTNPEKNLEGKKTSPTESEQDIEMDNDEQLMLQRDIDVLQKKICEFEICLMQMDATVGGLQKEREKINQENLELQKENEWFHQEIKFEKIHNADLKNELKKARRKREVVEEQDQECSNTTIFRHAHPVTIIKSMIQRMLLFTWWSGFWFFEGLSIFGWENKWEKMERKKKRLEEENKEVEEEVTRLKKYIEEQRKDLISQRHTNFELLNQLTECVEVNNRKIMVLEEIWKKVEGYTNVLEDHFLELKSLDWQTSTCESTCSKHGSASSEHCPREDLPRKILEG